MKPRTERRGEGAFYHALASLLFLAVCAWLGAALYARLTAPAPAAEEPEAASESVRLSGILLRREQPVDEGAFAGTAEGTRLSASRTGTESALYFLGCDGWESLSPADAQALTPGKLDALLAAEPSGADGERPRLVYGFEMLLAAFSEGAVPAPGACRLRLENVPGEVSARVLSVREEGGRAAVLLRLTEIPDELYRLRFVRAEIS